MLVVDANVAVYAAIGVSDFAELRDTDLVAPPLLWDEALSAIHEMCWRRELTAREGQLALVSLPQAPVTRHADTGLADEAWRIADELGWAKAYDAEYLALGRILGCRVVTLDGRLRRGAARLGFVVSPTEV